MKWEHWLHLSEVMKRCQRWRLPDSPSPLQGCFSSTVGTGDGSGWLGTKSGEAVRSSLGLSR